MGYSTRTGTTLPARSSYRGYVLTNSGIVVRIFFNDTMVHYGAMTTEEAHAWIDTHIKGEYHD